MSCWPCLAIYLYNKNQLWPLFTFNLFQSLTSMCFEQAYCSSSGGTTLYIQQLVYVMRLCWLAVGRIVIQAPLPHAKLIQLKSSIFFFKLYFNIFRPCQSQWPRGLRRRSAAARLLRLWVRTPPGAWMSVCCECCVLSGRGLCDALITHL